MQRGVLNHGIYLLVLQVCDSDTVLDPACTIEMLKVLEEDPEVGGVGGDVQVRNLPILVLNINKTSFPVRFFFIDYPLSLYLSDSEQVRLLDLLPEQCPVLDGVQHRAGLPVLLWMCAVHQWTSGNVPQLSSPTVPGALVPPDLPRKQVQLR